MNKDIMHGKWNEIKGEIRKVWGNITGDELEQSKGNLTSISGLIQQRYGQKKEDISLELNNIMSKFGHKTEDFKKSVAETTENIKNDLRRSNQDKDN